MHPLFYKLNFNNVYFSKHAKERLIQRFKLFLTSFEKERPELYLEKDFKNAVVNMADFCSPGYMNQLESKYGKNSFIARSKNLVYFCHFNIEENKVIIKSIIKNNNQIYI